MSGSLGGLQAVALCPGAGLHTRLLAAGREEPARGDRERRALTLRATRAHAGAPAELELRVASVWYLHSGAVLDELRACVAEFSSYLATAARGLRAAAADMVLPAAARRASLRLRVELESPVVVVPRAASSPRVFVAHLGRMTLAGAASLYDVRLRDISLYSLDAAPTAPAADMRRVYSCGERGRPVLHDTALHLRARLSPCGALSRLHGTIVGGLRVSAARDQYDQLLDTVRELTAARAPQPSHPVPDPRPCPPPATEAPHEPLKGMFRDINKSSISSGASVVSHTISTIF